MNRLLGRVATVFIAIAGSSAAIGREAAPGPDCFDARLMQEALLASPRLLAIALTDGNRYAVEMGDSCPAAIGGDGGLEVRAPLGWACSGNGALVAAADGTSCAVTTVNVIDNKQYAQLALAARDLRVRGEVPTLPALSTVEVRGERMRGFRGSANYCVAARHVRSWSTDDEGLIVEVSPRRAANNRYYRVEVLGACTMLGRSPAITLRSGVGTGLVCGFPGDRVELAEADDLTALMHTRLTHQRWPELEKSCSVLAVYPLPQR